MNNTQMNTPVHAAAAMMATAPHELATACAGASNTPAAMKGKPVPGGAKQKGMVELSMIQMLVILAGVGLLIAMLYPTVIYSWNKTQFISQYQLLRKAAESYKGSDLTFTGITIANMCTEKQLNPLSEMCTKTTTSNAFGGSWTIAAGTNPSQTTITATNLPTGSGTNLQRDMAKIGTATLSGTTLTITQ